MKANQKAGILIIIIGVLVSLTSLFLSKYWIDSLGFWENIIGSSVNSWLSWGGVSICLGSDSCMHTKYVLLSCIFLISYGLTVYLDILKAPEKLSSLLDE